MKPNMYTLSRKMAEVESPLQ